MSILAIDPELDDHPRKTRDQECRRKMLIEAVQAAPPQDLAMWLADALAMTDLPDDVLTDLGNRIGRIPFYREWFERHRE